jgi:hypothetical protein
VDQNQRDRTRIDPLSGAQDKDAARPLETVPPGKTPNATNAEIPGTGEVIKDDKGREAKRVVGT